MRGIDFIQGCIAFILLIISVMLFSLLKIDMNFITTFFFAIFTIAISIFFYNESTKSTQIIRNLIVEIKGKVEHMENGSKTEHLNILPTSLSGARVIGVYKKDGKN